jgi:hypothetical protein
MHGTAPELTGDSLLVREILSLYWRFSTSLSLSHSISVSTITRPAGTGRVRMKRLGSGRKGESKRASEIDRALIGST